MFDSQAEFMVIQARQQEIAAAARAGRWLADARASAQGPPGRQARRGSSRRGPGLRWRFGAALVLLGRWLQGGTSELPTASG